MKETKCSSLDEYGLFLQQHPDKKCVTEKSLQIHNSAINREAPGLGHFLFCLSKKVLVFFIFMLVIQSLVIAQTINLDSLLTPEEIAWLNLNKHKIRYAPNSSWPPGDYMEDGVHKGIVSDYINIFEKKLGVTFQRVYYQNWTDILEGLEKSEVDFVGAIIQTTDREAYLRFTQSFHKNTLGIVVRTNYEQPLTNEHIGTMRLACVENYTSTTYARQQFPNAVIIEHTFDLSALLSTSFGKTDGTVIDFMTASHLANMHSITNLQFAKQLDFVWNLRFASIKQKPLLASILDKLLSTITEEQRQEIVSRWAAFDVMYEPSFYERNKMLVWATVILLVAIILLAIFVNIYLKKQIRIRTAELVVARDNAIRNEEAARDLFEKHAAVKLIIDPETGNIIDANKSAATFYGWSEETLKGMNISQINTLPVDVIKKEYEKARTHQKTFFEFVHRKADGSQVDVEVFSSGIKIRGKEYLHSIVHDITEKKKAQQDIIYHSQMQAMLRAIAAKFINIPLELIDKEIQKSLEQLGNLVKADRVCIFDYDWGNYTCSNTFEWCNEGIKPQIDYLQNVPLDEIPQWVNNHKLGKALNIPDELNLPATDGVRKILEPQGIKSLIAIPIMNDELCVGFVGFDKVRKHHIFTESEEKFLFIYSQQFLSVKKRQILESSLIYAKEKAEESDRLKSAFLGNISHEVRTPMNAILGFSQLLKEPRFSGDQKEHFILTIEKSGQRMLNLISDIMDISKIESGLIELSESMVNIHESMHYVYDIFEPVFQTKIPKVTLKLNLPSESITLHTDKEKLHSVLINLLNNAEKFTKTGSVEFGFNHGDGVLVFFVKDSGIGIPKDMQPRVFERFFQVDTSTTRGHEGSGLGLSIAKAFIEWLGGKIWIDSEPDMGTTFYFTLPVHESLETSADRKVVQINQLIDLTGKKPTILIVEDDLASYEVIHFMLEGFKIEILHAHSGEEGIRILNERTDIDLILMDVKMPGIDGLETTRRIREFNKEVPIIAQTANALVGDREIAIKAGCNDYITKPIVRESLLNCIKKYI